MHGRSEAQAEWHRRGTSIEMAMTTGERGWRVGIIGVNPVGLFLLERIKLAQDIRVVGASTLIRRDCVWQPTAAVNFGAEVPTHSKPKMSTSCS